jgi:hypothetical protein
MIKDDSTNANNYIDQLGYIRMFTLFFHVKKNGQKLLEQCSINIQLLLEKIELSCDYFDNEIEIDNTDITNDEQCAVCLSNNGNLIKTNCNHYMHLTCAKSSPRMQCPICRNCIVNTLKNNNVSDYEIQRRQEIEKADNEMENRRYLLFENENEIDDFSDIDMFKLINESLKINNGNIISYFDLLFDMNCNASKYFANISKKMFEIGNDGVFMYLFDSYIEFLHYVLNFDDDVESCVEWLSKSDISELNNENKFSANIIECMNDRISRINPNNEYVVLILIENQLNAHIIHKNAYKLPTSFRLSKKNIIFSLLGCCKHRNIYNEYVAEKNKEYERAKNLLKIYNDLSKKFKRKKHLKFQRKF